MTARADALTRALRDTAFAPQPAGARPRIGAESELVALSASDARPVALEDVMLPFLRRFGAPRGWEERRSCKGTPSFALPDGGTLAFEPGGQIEYGSPPCDGVSALLRRMRAVVVPLVDAARDEGIALLATGIDPANAVRDVPLQLHAPRYARMASYLATIGEAGARMMRQTASLQVSLDIGEHPERRWRLLNATAPYVVAMFANSPIHAGDPTGHQSYRAHGWRVLDPSRTGVFAGAGDIAAEYARFALGARAMLHGDRDGRFESFGALLARGTVAEPDWEEHLTTLFPEVRPRGWLEVRSCDAVPLEWQSAPVCLLAGIAYDERAMGDALDLLAPADGALLERAGRCALRDPAIASTARDLATIALEGCARLRGSVEGADLEVARAFFDRYTRRGRSLADDALAAHEAGAGVVRVA
jgi:glutamate--cysteine ligase